MSIKRKISAYHATRARLAQLEQEIRQEAAPILRQDGLLALPRFEQILNRFAA